MSMEAHYTPSGRPKPRRARSQLPTTSVSRFGQPLPIDRASQPQRRSGLGHRIFEPAGAIEQDNPLVGPDPPIRERLLVSRVGRGTLGAEQQAFFRRNFSPCLGDRSVADGGGKAAALAYGAKDQEVADRLRHANAGRESMRILPPRGMLHALSPSLDYGRATLGLDDDHPRALSADPGDFLELGKGLPHADDAGTASCRIEDHVGQFPIELLGELDPHRLFSFDTVGLPECRTVKKTMGIELAEQLDWELPD